MTPRPTHVSVFTPATPGSQFVFNAGDQVRIRMTTAAPPPAGSFSTNGAGLYWGTSQNRPELAGALMCTPVSGPAAAVPEVVSAGFGSTRLTNRTAAITSQSMSSKTILTGYRLNGILIAAAQLLSPVVNVQVDIWNGSSETVAPPILQVFFTYIETTPTPTDPTQFRIPFSYAEYARDALSSRINPRTLVYNGPQNPIFNKGDVFRMRITVANVDMTIVTNGTDIAGQFWGIRLNTPTITFPNPPVTPQYVVGVVGRNTRRIPIPTPTSNSTGAFIYAVSSQPVTPTAALGAIGVGVSLIGSEGARPFGAWAERDITLQGFSFQFFGGYTTGSIAGNQTFTMRVWIMRGTARQPNELTITFRALSSIEEINRNNLDGTLAYIPFQQGTYITTPTFVRDLTYNGSLPSVLRGDLVNVSLAGGVGVLTRAVTNTSSLRYVGPIMGSLIH
jgi:hypothetical protein